MKPESPSMKTNRCEGLIIDNGEFKRRWIDEITLHVKGNPEDAAGCSASRIAGDQHRQVGRGCDRLGVVLREGQVATGRVHVARRAE